MWSRWGLVVAVIEDVPRNIKESMKQWLEILVDCGIDLGLYGTKEHSIFISNLSGDQIAYFKRWCLDWWDPLEVRLIDFTFGPKIEDWDLVLVFEWRWVVEGGLHDFWAMVEQCPPQFEHDTHYESDSASDVPGVPGAWVED
jgi:hypothetical protein